MSKTFWWITGAIAVVVIILIIVLVSAKKSSDTTTNQTSTTTHSSLADIITGVEKIVENFQTSKNTSSADNIQITQGPIEGPMPQ